jgi:hypothetical protein
MILMGMRMKASMEVKRGTKLILLINRRNWRKIIINKI